MPTSTISAGMSDILFCGVLDFGSVDYICANHHITVGRQKNILYPDRPGLFLS